MKEENSKKTSITSKLKYILPFVLILTVIIGIYVKVFEIGSKDVQLNYDKEYNIYDKDDIAAEKYEEREHNIYCSFYVNEKNCFLSKQETNIEGNCAYVTLRKAPVVIPGDKSDKDVKFEFSVRLPSGVDTLYIQDNLVWQRNLIIKNTIKDIYSAKCNTVSELEKCDKKIWDKIGMKEEFNISNYSYGKDNSEVHFDIGTDEQCEDIFISTFNAYASVILACVDELESVSCTYKYRGEEKNYSINCKKATKLIGKDIKDIGKKYSELQKLLTYGCFKWYIYNDTKCKSREKYIDSANRVYYGYKLSDYVKEESINKEGIFGDFESSNIDTEYSVDEKKITLNINYITCYEEYFKSSLKAYAYMNLALINDLDSVEFINTKNSNETFIITREDATKAIGKDISKYNNKTDLKELLEMVHAYNYFGQY